MEDISEWDSFSQRLAWFLSQVVDLWINGIEYEQLSDEQKLEFSKISAMKEAWLKEIDFDNPAHDQDKWAHYADVACNILGGISKCLPNADCRRYIFLADNYDSPLRVSHHKPWADQARRAYVPLIRQLLSSDIFVKCMVVGTFCYPLKVDDECDVNDMFSVSLNANRFYRGDNDTQPSDKPRSEAVASIFGLTSAQVTELAKAMDTPNSGFKSRLEVVVEGALHYSGGYDFGMEGMRYNEREVRYFLERCKRSTAETVYLFLTRSIYIHPAASLLAYERRAEMILLTSKLIHDFNTKDSGCHILHEDRLDYYSSQPDEFKMGNYIFQPEFVPWPEDSLPEINDFVNLMIHIGYLNVGSGNVLHTPSGKHRHMWERIQLLETFATINRVEQDTQRHQLIDSLYSGDTDELLEAFRSGITALHESNLTCSPNTRIEFACRYLICMLNMPKYHIISRPNVEFDYKFFSQLHSGKSQWEIALVPFGRYLQKLLLVFHIEHLVAENAENNEELLKQLAQCCLDKVAYQENVSSTNNSLRIDLGVAIGQDDVAIRHRCYGDFESI
ncbi:hypothetical protein H4R20_005652 [Coemansia guatemalensis]|uniref:Uncharacterized protein n=1 Tax=Coemansia guatemalensis TaxID=2761395 RepID=A0A9W8HP82_9FUNG|nr:hypothetical protein H4R20_005652 [Coemansia guatemalensis]